MKLLSIIATNRRKGNISTISDEILKGAKEKGHETETINLYDLNIKNCIGCWNCNKKGKCFIDDDFEMLMDKFKRSDVIILGTPCYWCSVSGVMKNFMDRHTGITIYQPENMTAIKSASFMEKFKFMLKASRDFGAIKGFSEKKYITIITATVPFPISHLGGDVSSTQRLLKLYIKKMKGNLYRKIIFTDTHFRFIKSKRDRIFKKAYEIGKAL